MAGAAVLAWMLVGATSAVAAGACGANGTFSQVGATASCTYTTPGEATFTVPSGVRSLNVVAVGGQGGAGGHDCGPGGSGGAGAMVTSTLTGAASPLYVEVGSNGDAGVRVTPGPGGTLDGGSGGVTQGGSCGGGGGGGGAGGGGGGSSDVRTSPASSGGLTGTAGDPRLVVAGGGGAGGGGGGTAGGAGGGAGRSAVVGAGDGGRCDGPGGAGGVGAGGGAAPGSCTPGSAGTPSSGGTGGAACCLGASGGGGGGGYIGGGGGDGTCCSDGGGGGGAGSSFGPAGTTYATASGGPSVTVSWMVVPSGTAIGCSPSSVRVGQATTCTVTVTGSTHPSGTVSFASNGSGSFSSTTCTLVQIGGNQARCSVTYTPGSTGSQTIYANYSGDAYNPPSHASTTITATSGPSTTTIGCGPASVHVNQPTTCTATVTGQSHPTGTVSFASNGSGSFSSPTCTLVLIGGNQARCSVTYTPSAVPPTTQTIYANYSGDANNLPSHASTTITVSL